MVFLQALSLRRGCPEAPALGGEMRSKQGMDHNRFYRSGDASLFLPVAHLLARLCFFSCLVLVGGC